MKYQLALQFPAKSIADYDEMIALEDELNKLLGSSSKVTGHDCGSGEMNIFIHTDVPEETFKRMRPVLAERESFKNLIAAYRELAGGEYSVLWPTGFNRQFRTT